MTRQERRRGFGQKYVAPHLSAQFSALSLASSAATLAGMPAVAVELEVNGAAAGERGAEERGGAEQKGAEERDAASSSMMGTDPAGSAAVMAAALPDGRLQTAGVLAEAAGGRTHCAP